MAARALELWHSIGGFKMMDVVLYNDLGIEIARESITDNRSEQDIIDSWTIYAGDRIEVVETWHEL